MAWRTRDVVKNESRDWYVVKHFNNTISCRHRTGLSAILDCGMNGKEYDIKRLTQCETGLIAYDYDEDYR